VSLDSLHFDSKEKLKLEKEKKIGGKTGWRRGKIVAQPSHGL